MITKYPCSISVFVDALAVTMPLTFTFTLTLALAVSFALSANVVAEHCPEDEVLLGCELIQRTSHDEPDGLQTLPSPKVNIYVLLPGRLQNIRNALTLQS